MFDHQSLYYLLCFQLFSCYWDVSFSVAKCKTIYLVHISNLFFATNYSNIYMLNSINKNFFISIILYMYILLVLSSLCYILFYNVHAWVICNYLPYTQLISHTRTSYRVIQVIFTSNKLSINCNISILTWDSH